MTALPCQRNFNSIYASVQQQAGLKAGDQGFQLAVEGNTHLKGAIIASSQLAINESRNQLQTKTLTQQRFEYGRA
ncbi:MAG: hypothetical protein AB2993_01775 [Candidatus Symbiodolus clandestinus]